MNERRCVDLAWKHAFLVASRRKLPRACWAVYGLAARARIIYDAKMQIARRIVESVGAVDG